MAKTTAPIIPNKIYINILIFEVVGFTSSARSLGASYVNACGIMLCLASAACGYKSINN